MQYALNVNAWIVRHPARQEVQDENGAVISRTDSYYDDETFSKSNFRSLTVGNLTLHCEWISPSNSSATILSARSRYDAYGNPFMLLDPLADGSGGNGHYREIAYDTAFDTYPIREIIFVGSGKAPLVFQAQYDYGFGTIIASFDFNTNQTAYGYDFFGRLINTIKPYQKGVWV